MERPPQSEALSRALGAACEGAPLLGDGGIGSQLLTSAFDAERDFLGHPGRVEVLGKSRQEQVQAVHESYFDAGCQWATTNTFGAWPREWAAREGEIRAAELIAGNAAAAIEAALAWGTEENPLFVIGSLGPGEATPGEADDGRRQDAQAFAQALVAGGVDALLIETALNLEDARAQLEACAEAAPERPRWMSIWIAESGRPADERGLDEWAALARELGVELLAVNCIGTLPTATAAARSMREHWDGPLGLWPNAGLPEGEAPNLRWSLDPEEFADALASAASELNLSAVGGCCGTGPAHLRRLAQRLGRLPADEIEDEEDLDEDEDDN